MEDSEIAEYLHKIITNPNMTVPVPECRAIVECQDWLQGQFTQEAPDADEGTAT